MKPTCPNACPLKQKMNEQKRSDEIMDEIRWNLEQMTESEKREMLMVATFIRFRYKGLGKFSTWLEMIKCQCVLYTIWGFFIYADNVIWRANHE